MKTSELNLVNNTKYNVKLIGGKNAIRLTSLPKSLNCDRAWFSLFNDNQQEFNSRRVNQYMDQLIYNVPDEAPGRYKLQIMLPKTMDSSIFASWLDNVPIIIEQDRMVYFDNSPVYERNVQALSRLKNDEATLKKYRDIPSGRNEDIIRKAYDITKWCFTDYSKALAIHDWIAANIYYDWDSYSKKNIDYSKLGKASEVFSRKLAVCAGYSDLAVVMLRALGIPAFSQSCYALGASTSKMWTTKNVGNPANHAITMVYLQKRWMIFDATWDSNNKYQNRSFHQDNRISHRYFDPTLQSLSLTHKLCI